jgi:hypothetical protein
MAETNTNEKKFFLDWGGLKTLWNKINLTFANKVEVEQTVENINTSITDLEAGLSNLDEAVNLRIDGVEDTMTTFMPREYTDYTTAVNGTKTLAAGTVIKVLTDSQLVDAEGNPIPDENGSTPTYQAGLYLVIDPANGVIEKISTASGTGTGGNIEEIAEFVEQLDKDVVKAAFITDENNETLTSVEFGDNALVFRMDDEFVVNSNSVNALTHRAVAAMFGDLKDQITQIPKFKIKVVDKLPVIGVDEISYSTIYLYRNIEDDPGTSNLYIEYICVQDQANGDYWEKLGEQSLVIEDFAKKEWVEDQIAFAMQNVVNETRLAEALETAKGEILVEVGETYITKDDAEKFIDQEELTGQLDYYYTKTESDERFLSPDMAESIYATKDDIKDFMTEGDIITSIWSGTIGENIRISDDQINSLTLTNIE